MISLGMLEHYLNGELKTQPCDVEADYYRLWHDCGFDRLAPVDAAIAGGLSADRLPWVFTAGYQATLRSAFGFLPDRGWAAFAATEDSQNSDAHPGTRLTTVGDGYQLDGYKSWVAHSRLVDHLLITVNDPAGDKYRARVVLVDAKATGVHLSHRDQPGFLTALSQGFARLERVQVKRNQVFEFESIRQFGRSEAKFVMLASVAFMLAQCSDSGLQDRLMALAASFASLTVEQTTSRQVYAAIERQFQQCVGDFESHADTESIPDYSQDRRLWGMYSAKIQRRAGYAREQASVNDG